MLAKIFRRVSTTLLIILFFMMVYVYTVLIVSNREHLDYKHITDDEKAWLTQYIYITYNSIPKEYPSKDNIRARVQKTLCPKVYIEQNLDNIAGQGNAGATILLLRIVQIKNSLTSYSYCFTLMHEYVHLHYMLVDERLVDFITIKLLFNSGDNYLKAAACSEILYKLQYDNGDMYDCSYYLYQYFNNI